MNVGTASYGTGSFRAIGSLSESAIVDFYGTGDLQPEKKLMFAILQTRLNAFKTMLKSGFLTTIMNGLILSSTSAKLSI